MYQIWGLGRLQSGFYLCYKSFVLGFLFQRFLDIILRIFLVGDFRSVFVALRLFRKYVRGVLFRWYSIVRRGLKKGQRSFFQILEKEEGVLLSDFLIFDKDFFKLIVRLFKNKFFKKRQCYQIMDYRFCCRRKECLIIVD